MTVAELTALSPAAERLRDSLASSSIGTRATITDLDLPTIEVAPEDWPALARFLRDDPGCRYDLFLDLCGVDLLPLAHGEWTVIEVNGAVEFTRDYRLLGDPFALAAESLHGHLLDGARLHRRPRPALRGGERA